MFKLILHIVISASVLASETFADDTSLCPLTLPRNRYLKSYKNSCLQFVNNEVSWYSARDTCTARGGTLARIMDQESQTFIINALEKDLAWNRHGVWIGADDLDKEGYWKWVTGESVSWGNWRRGYGPEHTGIFSRKYIDDCALIRLDYGGQWEDVSCDAGPLFHYSYICEFQKIQKTTTYRTTVFQTSKKTTASTSQISHSDVKNASIPTSSAANPISVASAFSEQTPTITIQSNIFTRSTITMSTTSFSTPTATLTPSRSVTLTFMSEITAQTTQTKNSIASSTPSLFTHTAMNRKSLRASSKITCSETSPCTSDILSSMSVRATNTSPLPVTSQRAKPSTKIVPTVSTSFAPVTSKYLSEGAPNSIHTTCHLIMPTASLNALTRSPTTIPSINPSSVPITTKLSTHPELTHTNALTTAPIINPSYAPLTTKSTTYTATPFSTTYPSSVPVTTKLSTHPETHKTVPVTTKLTTHTNALTTAPTINPSYAPVTTKSTTHTATHSSTIYPSSVPITTKLTTYTNLPKTVSTTNILPVPVTTKDTKHTDVLTTVPTTPTLTTYPSSVPATTKLSTHPETHKTVPVTTKLTTHTNALTTAPTINPSYAPVTTKSTTHTATPSSTTYLSSVPITTKLTTYTNLPKTVSTTNILPVPVTTKDTKHTDVLTTVPTTHTLTTYPSSAPVLATHTNLPTTVPTTKFFSVPITTKVSIHPSTVTPVAVTTKLTTYTSRPTTVPTTNHLSVPVSTKLTLQTSVPKTSSTINPSYVPLTTKLTTHTNLATKVLSTSLSSVPVTNRSTTYTFVPSTANLPMPITSKGTMSLTFSATFVSTPTILSNMATSEIATTGTTPFISTNVYRSTLSILPTTMVKPNSTNIHSNNPQASTFFVTSSTQTTLTYPYYKPRASPTKSLTVQNTIITRTSKQPEITKLHTISGLPNSEAPGIKSNGKTLHSISQTKTDNSNKKDLVIGFAVGGFCLLVFATATVLILLRKRRLHVLKDDVYNLENPMYYLDDSIGQTDTLTDTQETEAHDDGEAKLTSYDNPIYSTMTLRNGT